MTGTIRCLVVRVSEVDYSQEDSIAPSVESRKSWRDLLPGADPYIVSLIRKLQREVRDERAAQAMAAREIEPSSDKAQAWDMEYREICVEPESAISLLDLAAAAAGLPPTRSLWTESAAEDDGDEYPVADRSLRRPR